MVSAKNEEKRFPKKKKLLKRMIKVVFQEQKGTIRKSHKICSPKKVRNVVYRKGESPDEKIARDLLWEFFLGCSLEVYLESSPLKFFFKGRKSS